MKNIYILLFLSFSVITIAQNDIEATNSICISGKVKKKICLNIAVLDTFKAITIADQGIYNHQGILKDSLIQLKVIPIKSILSCMQLRYNKPKELNEFYFIFEASDKYRVVFSWNEIYNTDLGNHYYIIKEMNGLKMTDLKQRIAFISTADIQSGKRYIKGLRSIKIKSL